MATRASAVSNTNNPQSKKPIHTDRHNNWLRCKTVVYIVGGGVAGFLATTALIFLSASRQPYMDQSGSLAYKTLSSSLSACSSVMSHRCLLLPSIFVGLFVGLPMGIMGGAAAAEKLKLV